MEKFTPLAKFYTAAGTDGIDKFQLCPYSPFAAPSSPKGSDLLFPAKIYFFGTDLDVLGVSRPLKPK